MLSPYFVKLYMLGTAKCERSIHDCTSTFHVALLSSLTESLKHLDSFPGLGRSLGGGRGNPFWYSCLENPMDREAWQATVYGVSRVGHN